MPEKKQRYKLDVMIEQDLRLEKAVRAGEEQEAEILQMDSGARPKRVTKELVHRVIERVKRI